MGFQTTISIQQAPFVAGDFATTNPRSCIVSPQAGFIAGSTGLITDRFAWVDPTDASGRSLLNSGTGKPNGFFARIPGQALITVYLAEETYTVPVGFGVTIYGRGDYVVLVTVANATLGLKAFAKLSDGTMQPGAAGATISGYVETDYVITAVANIGELAIMTQ